MDTSGLSDSKAPYDVSDHLLMGWFTLPTMANNVPPGIDATGPVLNAGRDHVEISAFAQRSRVRGAVVLLHQIRHLGGEGVLGLG